MLAQERSALIRRYAAGPAQLEETLAAVPEIARQWRASRPTAIKK